MHTKKHKLKCGLSIKIKKQAGKSYLPEIAVEYHTKGHLFKQKKDAHTSASSRSSGEREGNMQLEMERRRSPPGAAALARWEERREAAATHPSRNPGNAKGRIDKLQNRSG